MNKIQQQINEKIREKLKNGESVEEWYERGVKENMRFLDWLLPLTK